MARPLMHTEELRGRLLDCAAELMAARGAAGVSLRDLAAGAGTSTTAIYSLFGGKQELLQAVVDEGFRSFGASQEEAARAGVESLGWAYREWALAHRHVYALMFSGAGGVVLECAPTPEVAAGALGPLLAAVSEALARHAPGDDASAVAGAIWAQVHGLVSLELAGIPAPAGEWQQAYGTALRGIGRAYFAPGAAQE